MRSAPQSPLLRPSRHTGFFSLVLKLGGPELEQVLCPLVGPSRVGQVGSRDPSPARLTPFLRFPFCVRSK